MKKKQLNLFGTKNQLSLFPEKPLETIPNPKYDKLGKQLEKELLDKLIPKQNRNHVTPIDLKLAEKMLNNSNIKK